MRFTLLVSLLMACSKPEEAPTPSAAAPVVATAEAPAPADAGPATTLPDAPLYDLPVALEDQDGRSVGLDVYRGHPVIVSMFYASCKAACPMLIARARGLESRLSPAAREALRFLFISFDPGRDGPERLRATAVEQGVDLSRWTLARPGEPDVRLLSGLLGVKFNRLSNGDFNHSSVLVLLDGDGRPVARMGSLAEDEGALVAGAERLVAGS